MNQYRHRQFTLVVHFFHWDSLYAWLNSQFQYMELVEKELQKG